MGCFSLTGIELIGFKSLNKKLQQLEELDKKIEIIALMVEKEAKELCPVRTGRLRASIHAGKENKYTHYVGTNVEYAPFVEFGTRKMRAQPYLRPAVKKVVNYVKLQGISWWID